MSFVSDDFTYADGLALETANNHWSPQTASTFTVNAGRVYVSTFNVAATYFRTEDPGLADYSVEADVILVGGVDPVIGSIGATVGARLAPTGLQGYYCGFPRGSDSATVYVRTSGGGQTNLFAVAIASPSGTYHFKLTVSGTTITGRCQRLSDNNYLASDGSWQVAATDFGSTTDATITAKGSMGIYVDPHGDNTTAAGAFIDNFSGGVNVALAPGTGTCTSFDSTTASFNFTQPTGGTGPYTITYELADDINGTNRRNAPSSTDGLTTFTLTGLTADKAYVIGQHVVDSLGVIVTGFDANYYLTTALTGALTLPSPRIIPKIYQSGDSITIGGSPTSVATMATVLSGLLDSTVTSTPGGVGGSGIEQYVNADLSLTTLGSNMVADIASFAPTDWQVRLGINSTITKADYKSRMLAFIADVTAAAPSIVRVWMLYCLRHHGLSPAFISADEPRIESYWAAEQEIVAAGSGNPEIAYHMGNPWVPNFFNLYRGVQPDGTHPNQGGYNSLGTMDAYWWFDTVVGGLSGGGATVGTVTVVQSGADAVLTWTADPTALHYLVLRGSTAHGQPTLLAIVDAPTLTYTDAQPPNLGDYYIVAPTPY